MGSDSDMQPFWFVPLDISCIKCIYKSFLHDISAIYFILFFYQWELIVFFLFCNTMLFYYEFFKIIYSSI